MLKNVLIISGIFFGSFASFAGTITDIAINTQTASAVDTTVPTNIIVYGGTAGNISSCNPETLCDTCAIAPALGTYGDGTACNTRAVNQDLDLYVSFKASEIPTAATILVKLGDTTLTVSDKTADASLAANTNVFVKIAWGAICAEAGMPNCFSTLNNDTAFSAEIKIGISAENGGSTFSSEGRFTVKFRFVDTSVPFNATSGQGVKFADPVGVGAATTCLDANEGYCYFTSFPGDEKVYIKNLTRPSTGPGGNSGIRWKAVRVYYALSTGTPGDLTPADSYKDLKVVNKDLITSDVEPRMVDGLANDQTYMFAIASVDEAENVNFFSDPVNLGIQQTAMPGEVVGLLDDKSCFIATAAFGSSQDPYVFILRKFRDRFLKTNSLGASFVDFYYEHSPVIADFIAKHDTLRAVVRVILWPLIGFASASLSFGAGTAIALLLGLMVTGILLFVRRRQVV